MDESVDVRLARIEERLNAMDTALKLQADEYERRLETLNHAHEQAVQVQHTYVTQDKYEDKLKAEADARGHALTRVDERFDEHVRRYEQRHSELEELLRGNVAALSSFERSVEQGARAAKDSATEATRKQNRNLAVASFVLAALVVAMNLVAVAVR